MSDNNLSVYQLITKLCEKFASKKQSCKNKTKLTRILRSRVYDIILYKKHREIVVGNDYKSITSIYNKIRFWFFILNEMYGYEDPEIEKIEKHVDNLEQVNEELTEKMLTMLFLLRKTNIIQELEYDPFTFKLDEKYPWHIYSNLDFKIENDHMNYRKYNDNKFKLNSNDQELFLLITQDECSNSVCNEITNVSTETEYNVNVWEDDIAKSSEIEERNWEANELTNKMKSLSILSESFTNYNLSLHCLHEKQLKLINIGDYIHDVINVLVGIPSKSFGCDCNGQFNRVLVSIKGMNQIILDQHSKIFMNCGNKFMKLQNLVNQMNFNINGIQKSFIYQEFINCIKRYLNFYNSFIFLTSNQNNLSMIKCIAENLLEQLDIFSDIFEQILPKDGNDRINCAKMFNYLYERVDNLIDGKKKHIYLYILYPCLQTYYSRFLQLWLFEGLLNDPYNEFFINFSAKYVNKKDRTYWKKCYIINESKVPHFLISLKEKILLCGKSVQVLKISNLELKKKYEMVTFDRPTLTCCITYDQVKEANFNINKYNLKILEIFGKPFSFSDLLRDSTENQDKFLTMVAYKRTTTLKRIELEKLSKIKIENERKQSELQLLKEQYYEALHQKRANLIKEMAREIQETELNMQMEEIRNQMLEEETKKMIDYYDNLMQEAELRRKLSEQHMLKWKAVQLYLDDNLKIVSHKNVCNVEKNETLSDTETNDIIDLEVEGMDYNEKMSASAEALPENQHNMGDSVLNNNVAVVDQPTNETCLDVVNANVKNDEITKIALDNFEMARRNKEKVMASEFDLMYRSPQTKTQKTIFSMSDSICLTEAQRNKLKVMSSEYHINLARNVTKESIFKASGDAEANNLNLNVPANINHINNNVSTRKLATLKLDFTHLKSRPIFEEFLQPPNFELAKLTPMSTTSTPISDITPLSSVRYAKSETSDYETPSDLGTATSSKDFNFNSNTNTMNSYDLFVTKAFSKMATSNNVTGINESLIKFYSNQSIETLLKVQSELIDNALMRYFVVEMNYMKLLKKLSNYFFLMDGEFCAYFTDNLFKKIYSNDISNSNEILSIYSLKLILQNANSHVVEDTIEHLSIKINRLPKRFDLRDPNFLQYFSLTYKIDWPLNVLLPAETIEKYNEIFHFLMKLQRVTWILKRVFLDLNLLTKQHDIKTAFLLVSPQYQALHQYRHIMTQFFQSLQNYIIGDVLQTCGKLFEEKLIHVTSIDSLYEIHVEYIKNILSRCFLNEASIRIREVLHKILVRIFKFYDYLRSRTWIRDEMDGTYLHPNFGKLKDLFVSFKEMILYFYKVLQKITSAVHQEQLSKLLTSWDLNNYYLSCTSVT